LYIIFENFNKIYKHNPKFICKFAEFQIKIKSKNYVKINDFIDIIFMEFEKLDNFAITIYFYELNKIQKDKEKDNSINKISENLLMFVYQKLKERKISHFILKFFFILNENINENANENTNKNGSNSVEYKYFIFQENPDYLIKKSDDHSSYSYNHNYQSNKNNILKTTLVIKATKNNNLLRMRKDSLTLINTKNIKYIDFLLRFKILKKILMNKNIKNKLEDFLRSKKILQRTSTNTSNNQNSLCSNNFSENYSNITYKSNQSENCLLNIMKEYKIEKTSRKFLINLKNPENYQKGYKEFYTELYKIS
jgi:hypothetical protein